MDALHLFAFQKSIAQTVYGDVQAVNDNVLTLSNNHLMLPKISKMFAALAVGLNIQQFRFNAPSLRSIGLPEFPDVNVGTTVVSPVAILNRVDEPLILQPSEEIEVDAIQTSVGAQNATVLVALQLNPPQRNVGPIFTIKYTTVVTGAFGSWTSGTMSPTQTIQNGTYAIVGMSAIGAALLGARLIIPNQVYRPGCFGRQAYGNFEQPIFRANNLGTWGTITPPFNPTIEIIGSGACTNPDVYLDLIKLN